MKLTRKKIYMIIIILAAIAGYFLFKGNDSSKSPGLSYVKPERGSIEQTVTAQGRLEPKEYVDVGTQVTGQLTKLYFDIGATVKKGDLLAEIDPEIYESQVEADLAKLSTMKAQLAQQQAQTELAQLLYNRNLRLIKSDAISKQALDESLSALKVAKAGVDSINAQIKEAESTLKGNQANLGYSKIYAPIDGTIVSEAAKEGQTLNSNQSTPTVLQIANLDVMTVKAQVAEADILNLKPGMDVYFTILGSTERKWQGKLRQILPTPDETNNVVLYSALIDVENKDRQLLTGMTAQVFFVLGAASDKLFIPVSALGKHMTEKDNESGKAYEVKVKTSSGTETKIVYIGLMNRVKAEVISGLGENDEVAVSGSITDEAGGKPVAKGKKQGSFKGGPRL